MKPWRAFLLVLLILLLPLRGAVAATMLCPTGHHAQVVSAPHAPHAHDAAHDAAHAHHMDHGGVQRHADEAVAKGTVSPGSSCHVCASFCSATPLLAAMPVIQQPGEAQRLSYPAWAAPAPLFLSGGQERPPRST